MVMSATVRRPMPICYFSLFPHNLATCAVGIAHDVNLVAFGSSDLLSAEVIDGLYFMLGGARDYSIVYAVGYRCLVDHRAHSHRAIA